MEPGSKKVEVLFVHDKDVQLIKYQDGNFLTSGPKRHGKADRDTPRRKGEVSQGSDPELFRTLVEEPQVDEDLCSSDKPSALFQDGDVTGQQLFGFQTPKRRNAMAHKVAESCCNSPAEQRTPSSKTGDVHTPRRTTVVNGCHTPKNKTIPVSSVKTPYNLRKKLQRKIVAAVNEAVGGSSENDFSDSGSEWDEDSDSSSNDDGEASRSEGENEAEQVLVTRGRVTASQGKSTKLNYVPLPEDYFLSHASSKVRTSNRTLSRLHTPRLLQEQLQELLAQEQPSHLRAFAQLEASHHSLFPKWTFTLEEGFNILLYGVGSKRRLLNTFRSEYSDPSIVVNGFFPSLTIQEMVDTITSDVLGVKGRPMELFEAVAFIRSNFSGSSGAKLYLFVHNIDGPMLRNGKSQEVLAALANTANIHLLATMDHINAPLMWDQALLSQFNFLWWDVTTFQPYTDETSFESSLLVQRSGGLALSSLQNVFRSLTSNAKSVFLLMAQYQLSHQDNSNFTGMPFRDLYSSCRESLLVSSDLALRSQLTEFLDHRLVRTRRGGDGSELLDIPVNSGILSQFVEQQQAEML